jgi:hypothetical protein
MHALSLEAPAEAAPRPRAIVSPLVDALTVGGALLITVGVCLATGVNMTGEVTLARANFLQYSVNSPHFLASYWLLYGSRAARQRYPLTSWVVPLFFASWAALGLVLYARNPAFHKALMVGSALLLAWHYTGQAFGMMTSYGYVTGTPLAPLERKLVRANFSVLLVFHMIWALHVEPVPGTRDPQVQATLMTLYYGVAVAAAVSSLFGAAALARLWSRTGRLPSLRTVLPWLAIHVWYALMYHDARALFWAQIGHSLQYLVFPMRVHINRAARDAPSAEPRSLLPQAGIYYLGIVAAGLLLIHAIPWVAQAGLATLVGAGSVPPLAQTIVTVLNVHHYFVDGAVWKLSNPEVRKDLFAHLDPRLPPK